MPRFVSLAPYRDFVLAISDNGDVYRMWYDDSDGQFRVQKELKLGY